MRKVIFAVVAAAALPSVAMAAPGGVPGAPTDHQNSGRHIGPAADDQSGNGGRHVGPAVTSPTTTDQTAPTADDQGKGKGKGQALGQAKMHKVAFVMRGTLSAGAVADSVAMDVRGGNRHARRALAGADGVTVKLDATTRIWKAGIGKAAFSDLSSGDRVIVIWRAPKNTAAADLPAARFVIDIGPKPAPAAAPTTTAPTTTSPTTPAPPAGS